MKKSTVINFFNHMVNKLEPDYTFKLVEIIYSEKHGHEICVMQLAGKNAFPKYTPEEILKNPKAMIGLSSFDAAIISKLDCEIKNRKNKKRVLEVDTNGTILLKDPPGKIERYSEKLISSDRKLLNDIESSDAHDIGYRVGYREGLSVHNKKKSLSKAIKKKLFKVFPIP